MPNSTTSTLTLGPNPVVASLIIDEECMSNVEIHFSNNSGGNHGCDYTSSSYGLPNVLYSIECKGSTDADSGSNGDTISYYYSYDIDNSASGCDDPHICTFEGKHYELD